MNGIKRILRWIFLRQSHMGKPYQCLLCDEPISVKWDGVCDDCAGHIKRSVYHDFS